MKINSQIHIKKSLSSGTICLLVVIGLLLTLSVLTASVYFMTREALVLSLGFVLTAAALFWLFVLILLLRHKLSGFTDDLCVVLDNMMSGNKASHKIPDHETLFSRIHTRLQRLYEIMEKNQQRVYDERRELQSLVSDISHQVKTPVSNLKMLTETLLTKPVSQEEQQSFLMGMHSQLDKLDFLFGAMVKSSRLETGLIRLERVQSRIYDTLAQALFGIIYHAEEKGISITINCSETLQICHDSKWTTEALFNILDNAVKYTPDGGQIWVTVEEWELYVKISVTDTGKGIPEEHHAAIFRRFYREEDVHTIPGVGIGLHLTREIVIRQGGYIKLTSGVGQGTTFSVFLPKR